MLKKNAFARNMLCCFLAVMIVLSSIQLINMVRLHRETREFLLEAANRDLNISIERIDSSINAIIQRCQALFNSSEFESVCAKKSSARTDYDYHSLYNRMKTTFADDTDLLHIVILFQNQSRLVSDSGIWDSNYYFDSYLKNQDYTSEFWTNEASSLFVQRFYPAKYFQEVNIPQPSKNHLLMPLALKPNMSSGATVVVFFDCLKILNNIDTRLKDSLYLSWGNQFLYSCDPANETKVAELMQVKEQGRTDQTKNDYIVIEQSRTGKLIYGLKIDGVALDQIVRMDIIQSLIFLLGAALAGILIAVLSVRRFAKPIANIAGLVGKREDTSLKVIRDNVERMVGDQEAYLSQIMHNESIVRNLMSFSIVHRMVDCPAAKEEARQGSIIYLNFYQQEDNETLDGKIQGVLMEFFSMYTIFSMSEGRYMIVVSDNDSEDFRTAASKVYDMLKARCGREQLWMICEALSENGGVSRSLSDEYGRMQRLEEDVPVSDFGCLSFANDICAQSHIKNSLPEPLMSDMKEAFEQKDEDEARNLTDVLLEKTVDAGITNGGLRMAIHKLSAQMLKWSASDDTEKIEKCRIEIADKEEKMERCLKREEYRSIIYEMISVCFSALLAHEDNKESPVVEMVRGYVEANYGRDFTMDELSASLKLSKGYVSTCFKKQNGQNLSDFIQAYRIEKSAVLLRETDGLVNDIGKMVGIANPNTFVRAFRKHYQCTPTEYRRTYILKEGFSGKEDDADK